MGLIRLLPSLLLSSTAVFPPSLLSLSSAAQQLISSPQCSQLSTSSSCRASGITQGQEFIMAQPVVIKPTAAHSATVVFLHGLGDTGNGWSPVFESARAPHVKYICPSAGSRPVTINMGMSMPAWFDIKGLSMDSEEDEAGIKQSAKQIHSILDAEVAAGIPSERIILGGFSMGGALAIYTALTYPKRLAGVVALSSFIIMRNHLPGTVSANHQVPIFQGHGDVDPLVALPFARATHELLKAFNPNATFKLYSGMGHSASDKELKDVQAFLEKNIKAA